LTGHREWLKLTSEQVEHEKLKRKQEHRASACRVTHAVF
jgi:hypothetical protein